jgi:hypothetical protein
MTTDYFVNHARARRFPWTLYHQPLERDLARFLPRAALGPAVRLVRWAVSDPLVPVDSPTAYEYLLIADAAELPAR